MINYVYSRSAARRNMAPLMCPHSNAIAYVLRMSASGLQALPWNIPSLVTQLLFMLQLILCYINVTPGFLKTKAERSRCVRQTALRIGTKSSRDTKGPEYTFQLHWPVSFNVSVVCGFDAHLQNILFFSVLFRANERCISSLLGVSSVASPAKPSYFIGGIGYPSCPALKSSSPLKFSFMLSLFNWAQWRCWLWLFNFKTKLKYTTQLMGRSEARYLQKFDFPVALRLCGLDVSSRVFDAFPNI